jgi:hypothetical protein
MAPPFIIVSTFRVNEGSLEGLKDYYRRYIEIVGSNEPRAIAFHGFLTADGTEMTNVQVHPDTASFDVHMQVLRDNWEESFSEYASLLEGMRVDYYGASPPESALEIDWRERIDSGIKPVHIAGFTRSQAG